MDSLEYFDKLASQKRRLKARRLWDSKHYRTVGAKLTISESREFAEICKEHGTTRNRVLCEFVRSVLRENRYRRYV